MLTYMLALLATLTSVHSVDITFDHCLYSSEPPCASIPFDAHMRAHEIDLSSHMASPPGSYVLPLGSPVDDYAYATSPLVVLDAFSYYARNAHSYALYGYPI